MSEAEIRHLHEDMEMIRQELAITKHILSEEGELTADAQKRLEKARKMPLSYYKEL